VNSLHPTVRITKLQPRRAVVALRLATHSDRARIWGWNNDPEVRAVSLDQRPISAETHLRWFAARMADPLTRMSIILADGLPVGLVRLQRSSPSGTATISIVLEASARGRGVGKAAIELACTADGGPVTAEILETNAASLACFEAAGFTTVGGGAGVRILTWSL
jgi:UDP-2,4-diacetamido-2,4,6-trideoxy-beta-L-altropyranose hydrolase